MEMNEEVTGKADCPVCGNTRKLKYFEQCYECNEYICTFCTEFVIGKGFICLDCKRKREEGA